MRIWVPLIAMGSVSGLALAEVDASITFVGTKGVVRELFFLNGGKVAEVDARMTGLSKPVSYKGPAELAFHEDRRQLSNGEGEPAFSVSLPESSDRILVVFTESEDGGQAASAFDNSDLVGKDRMIKFVNLTDKALEMKVGEIVCNVGEGGEGAVSKADLEEDEVQVQVREASEEGEPAGRLYYTNNWGIEGKTHDIVLLFKSESRARPIEVRRFEKVLLDK